MKNKTARIFIILGVVFIAGISGLVLWFHLSSELFEADSFIVSNVSSNSVTIFWRTDKPTVTSARATLKDFNQGGDWYNDDREDEDHVEKRMNHYVTFNEVESGEEYMVEVANTIVPGLLSQNFYTKVVVTKDDPKSSVSMPERVYGYVSDEFGDHVDGAIVFLTIDNEEFVSTFTRGNGSYSLDVGPIAPHSDNYIERLYIDAEGYEFKTFVAQSSIDQPVPDINLVLEGNSDGEDKTSNSRAEANVDVNTNDAEYSSEWIDKLSGNVLADNTCYQANELGGVRAQCDTNVHWMTRLNVNNCPLPYRFRVGLVAHSYMTFLYEPDNIRLKLIDDSSGETVLEDITNGGFVIRDRTELEFGETGKVFRVVAYNAGTGEECENLDVDCYVEFKDKTETYSTVDSSAGDSGPGSSPGGTSGTISSGKKGLASRAQSCKKFGENFAVLPPVGQSDLQKASELGYRWGEVIAVSNGQVIGAYSSYVKEAWAEGITPILRICYTGTCDIEDGEEYGQAITTLYNNLLSEGRLPDNGLFIHAGHNEPNASEYRSPKEEGEFIADVVRTLRKNDIDLSHDPNDSGIKLIISNLDLYNTTTAPGSNVYTARDYLEEMTKYFGGVSEHLYAIAVNDYFKDRGINVYDDLANIEEYIKSKSSLPNKIFLTEVGKMNQDMTWSQFGSELARIDSMPSVQAILMFDSLGLNPDINFRYHKELWDDPSIIQNEITIGCGLSGSWIPQEGSVSPSPGSGTPGNSGPVPVGPVTPTDGLYCGNFDCIFVKWNNINEVYLPQYWGAWYDEDVTRDADGRYWCGDFQNDNKEWDCGRPEYGQMPKLQFANRAQSGSALKYFTTFRTHNAGVYTSIRIGSPGVEKEVKFKVNGISWTAPDSVAYNGAVGIHPDGGIDPHAAVWGETIGLDNVQPDNNNPDWRSMEVTLKTTSDIVTVFIRGNNQYAETNNDSYWDNAEFYVDGVKSVMSDSMGNVVASSDDGEEDVSLASGDTVLGTSSIRVDESGKYKVTSEKYHILQPYVSKFGDGDYEVRFFYDENSNLTKDPRESFMTDMQGIELEKVGDIAGYELKNGFNFVSFPVHSEGVDKVTDFIAEVRNQGGDVTSVSTYFSGKWNSYIQRGSHVYGENFDILPSRGYIVNVLNPVSLVLDGDSYKDPVQISLLEGWNLVAIHGSPTSYTAGSFLSVLASNSKLDADNISTWSAKNQRYSGYQVDLGSGDYYGEDFMLFSSGAYFVRVVEGSGTLKP